MKNFISFFIIIIGLVLSNYSFAASDITAIVSIQDAEGYTQKDFNLDLLRAFENETVTSMKEKMSANLKDKGFPNARIDIEASSVYLEVGGKKLAVIRHVHPKYPINQVFIFGIVGKELRRVLCTRNSAEKIPLSYGVCANKIEEVYGVKQIK